MAQSKQSKAKRAKKLRSAGKRRALAWRKFKPRRIQRRRTKGWKMPPNTVYVGRGSKWGNQFKIGHYGFGDLPKIKTVKGAVKSYRAYINARLYFKPTLLKELKGKHLACWCPLDKPCHADVLLEIANSKAMAEMSLSMWTNDIDFVIAGSAAEAQQICLKFYESDDIEEVGDFETLADDYQFTLRIEGEENRTQAVKQWIAEMGKGYFANSEY